MVRMVYRKGFYSTELKICDEKMELWRKTENIRLPKKMKNQFWGLTSTFEVIPKTEMIFKNILYYSWVIPSQFPCKIDLKLNYRSERIVEK